MTVPAADDFSTIREKVEYERGFDAGFNRRSREPPPGCMDGNAWRRGWYEGDKLKRPLEDAS
jgi:hypothetical protein